MKLIFFYILLLVFFGSKTNVASRTLLIKDYKYKFVLKNDTSEQILIIYNIKRTYMDFMIFSKNNTNKSVDSLKGRAVRLSNIEATEMEWDECGMDYEVTQYEFRKGNNCHIFFSISILFDRARIDDLLNYFKLSNIKRNIYSVGTLRRIE